MRKSIRTLPVSKKAYRSFVDRINDVLGHGSDNASRMLKALDAYLEGNPEPASRLNAACRLAFGFLRHDIDCAMARSNRARERANRSKVETAPMHSSCIDKPETALSVQDKLLKLYKDIRGGTFDGNAKEVFVNMTQEWHTESKNKADETARPISRRERRELERAIRGKRRLKRLCPIHNQ